jgi:hypothetical protein
VPFCAGRCCAPRRAEGGAPQTLALLLETEGSHEGGLLTLYGAAAAAAAGGARDIGNDGLAMLCGVLVKHESCRRPVARLLAYVAQGACGDERSARAFDRVHMINALIQARFADASMPLRTYEGAASLRRVRPRVLDDADDGEDAGPGQGEGVGLSEADCSGREDGDDSGDGASSQPRKRSAARLLDRAICAISGAHRADEYDRAFQNGTDASAAAEAAAAQLLAEEEADAARGGAAAGGKKSRKAKKKKTKKPAASTQPTLLREDEDEEDEDASVAASPPPPPASLAPPPSPPPPLPQQQQQQPRDEEAADAVPAGGAGRSKKSRKAKAKKNSAVATVAQLQEQEATSAAPVAASGGDEADAEADGGGGGDEADAEMDEADMARALRPGGSRVAVINAPRLMPSSAAAPERQPPPPVQARAPAEAPRRRQQQQPHVQPLLVPVPLPLPPPPPPDAVTSDAALAAIFPWMALHDAAPVHNPQQRAGAVVDAAHEDDTLCVCCLDAERDTPLPGCAGAHPPVMCGACAVVLCARASPACPLCRAPV